MGSVQDEPDLRPLPETNSSAVPSPTSSTPLRATLRDTRLEPDLDDLPWPTVNLFHCAARRIEHELDDKRAPRKCRQKEQDGPEIRAVELERRLAQGPHSRRTARRHGALARSRRGTLRAPHRLSLAPVYRLDGQPPHLHGGRW